MKAILTALILMFSLSAATFAAEEGGEHAEHKAPPVPSKGTPVGDVYHLPVVAKWNSWLSAHNQKIAVWGESITTVEGQQCSEVAVGQSIGGHSSIWKRFCVPMMGGDILVESRASAQSDITYLTYDKWVDKCKPTDNSGGSC